MHWLNIKQKKIKIVKYEMIFSWKAESWIGHSGAFFLPTNSFQKFSYMERNPFFKQNILWFIAKNTNVMILEWNKQNNEVYSCQMK